MTDMNLLLGFVGFAIAIVAVLAVMKTALN